MAQISHLFLLFAIGLCQLIFLPSASAKAVYFLEPHSRIHVVPEIGSFGYAKENMNTFCYKGIEKDIRHMLKTVILNIEIEDDDFTCYHGASIGEVKEAQDSHKSIFSFSLFSHSKKRNVKLNPFNHTCIGVETHSEYIVSLQTIKIDLSRLGLLIGGLLLFFLSAKLSKNSAFFYLCGILLGVFASVLVLIWFISKLIPRKPLMYGALFSGWALVAYVGQILYNNIQPLLIVYQKYVLIYVLTTSIISFAVCYYMGPPKSQRTKRLIMWTLQLLGLFAIYFSSDFFEATLTIAGLAILTYYVPFSKFPSVSRIFPFSLWHRFFPPKQRLLTAEEFEELGRQETEKALKDLREYVRSPNCKQWKVVMNLSQPTRFASFVEGDSHLTMDETRNYENTFFEVSDDDEEEDDMGEESGEKSDTSSEDSLVEDSIAIDRSLNIINKSRLASIKRVHQQQALKMINKTGSPATNGRTPKMTPQNTSTRTTRTSNRSTRRVNKNDTYELSEDDD